MWVASQDRTTDDTYWIGQAYAVPGAKASDPCVHKKVEGRTEWLAGVQFDRGDYAVAVKWWKLTADDPEERTYEEWEPTQAEIAAFGIETPNGPYFLVNSTELRHIGFQMDSVAPPPASPVPVAMATRRARAVAQHMVTLGCRFRLPPDVGNQILALCW